nr:MAG TPA: hypothetical protein [Caudoviricetes sp.]
MENKIIFARMKDVVVNSLETIILPIKVVIQTLIVKYINKIMGGTKKGKHGKAPKAL